MNQREATTHCVISMQKWIVQKQIHIYGPELTNSGEKIERINDWAGGMAKFLNKSGGR